MTSVTIRAQDMRPARSHLILSPNLGQGLLCVPFSAFPAIVPGLAEERLPEASRSLECIMKSPACERKGLCLCG